MKPPALLLLIAAAALPLLPSCRGFSYRVGLGYEQWQASVEIRREGGKNPVRVQPQK